MDIEKIKKNKTTEELLEFGIINIDKPSGPTSFTVSEFVKKSLGLRKTSHMGTLDPQVSGVLPVTLNRACRLSSYLMKKDKEYIGVMRLHQEIDEKKLREEMLKFKGKITQLPPVRSRVKREHREREVMEFEIHEIDGKDVLFRSFVEAGTYIRTLVHDLGEKIGGAHMLELRRTRAGIFNEKEIYTLYDLENAIENYKKGDEKKLREMIVPAEIISQILEVVFIKEEFISQCMRGSPLFLRYLDKKYKIDKESRICVFYKERFIGCYRVTNQGEVFAVPEFVLN